MADSLKYQHELIDKLLDKPSLGEAARDLGFGAAVLMARMRTNLPMVLVERWSGMTEGRIREIEAGAPPAPMRVEITALEHAFDINVGSLWTLYENKDST